MIPAGLAPWMLRHGVTPLAMQELAQLLGLRAQHETPTDARHGSEAYVQSAVRLEAAQAGWRLWRNNVGVLEDVTGRPVRYGLGNDSPKLNAVLKSADLVGWAPIVITPAHVGQTIAQFKSRECKPAGWTYTGTPRETAQLTWANLINVEGGDAKFASGPGTI